MGMKTQHDYWQEDHNRTMEEMRMIYGRGPSGKWQPKFAWRPVRDIHGNWHWLSCVYKRERNIVIYPHQGYEYGTAFDVLKDA